MRKSQPSRLSMPYLLFLQLSTSGKRLFSEKVYEMREYFRLCAFDISIRIAKGTFLMGIYKTLQKYIQKGYLNIHNPQKLMEAQTLFWSHYRYFAVISILILCAERASRRARNKLFNDEQVSETTLEANNAEPTFHLTPAEKAKNTLQSPKSLTDIAKSYYNITQKIAMAPLELTMYFYVLGPSILTVMLVLAFTTGYIATKFSELDVKLREDQNAKSNEVTGVLRNKTARLFLKGIKELKKPFLKRVLLKVDLEFFTKSVSPLAFSLIMTALFASFVFSGHWDMVLLAVQTKTATEAYKSISSYLVLPGSHTKFAFAMKDMRESYLLKSLESVQVGTLQGDAREEALNQVYYQHEAWVTFGKIKDITHENLMHPDTKKIRSAIKQSNLLDYLTKDESGTDWKENDRTTQSDLLTAVNEIWEMVNKAASEKRGLSEDEINHLLFSILNNDTAKKLNRAAREQNSEEKPLSPYLLAVLTYHQKHTEMEEKLFDGIPNHRPSASIRILTYLAIGIAVLGFMFAPLPNLTPMFSMLYGMLPGNGELLFRLAGGYVCISVLADKINTPHANANNLSKLMLGMLYILSAYFALQFYTLSSMAFIVENANILACGSAVFLSAAFIVDYYLLPAALYNLNYVLTWVSQELTMVAKAPMNSARFAKSYLPEPSKIAGKFNPLGMIRSLVLSHGSS